MVIQASYTYLRPMHAHLQIIQTSCSHLFLLQILCTHICVLKPPCIHLWILSHLTNRYYRMCQTAFVQNWACTQEPFSLHSAHVLVHSPTFTWQIYFVPIQIPFPLPVCFFKHNLNSNWVNPSGYQFHPLPVTFFTLTLIFRSGFTSELLHFILGGYLTWVLINPSEQFLIVSKLKVESKSININVACNT